VSMGIVRKRRRKGSDSLSRGQALKRKVLLEKSREGGRSIRQGASSASGGSVFKKIVQPFQMWRKRKGVGGRKGGGMRNDREGAKMGGEEVQETLFTQLRTREQGL